MILSIGESKPKKWKPIAEIIKAVEGTDHTHSFISWHDEALDFRKVSEARGGGGRIVINHQFREENHVVRVFQYEITKEKLIELERWIWEHMRPYGYKHMLGLAWMRLEMQWNPKAKNHFKDGEFSMVCVELSARAIQLATGIALPGDVEDYGLLEMHDINMENAHKKLCTLAPDELIARINAG
jgi:hypothetical protein